MQVKNQADVIKKMSEDANISLNGAKAAFKSFTKNVTHGLNQGDKVVLMGWGVFSVVKKAARMGRDPRTGAQIRISTKNVVKFKVGKELREAIN